MSRRHHCLLAKKFGHHSGVDSRRGLREKIKNYSCFKKSDPRGGATDRSREKKGDIAGYYRKRM